jgi:hypothetical protein
MVGELGVELTKQPVAILARQLLQRSVGVEFPAHRLFAWREALSSQREPKQRQQQRHPGSSRRSQRRHLLLLQVQIERIACGSILGEAASIALR